MKYIGQFGIILVISFTGEILNYFIPLPVPASIYGLVIMFLCLHFRIIRVDTVKDTADFLIEIMPLMFIPAAVELMTLWHVIKPNLIAYGVITVVSTFAVMIISGHVTQFALHRGQRAVAEPVAAENADEFRAQTVADRIAANVCIEETDEFCSIRKGEGNGTL